eukprot:Gregarina_sp_Poly_1__10485@NODE_767_length_6374_cov_59_374822_g564_i0_p7_GENE_NODE_767_length_6374_cov_59_374822_g564_i0NODE_767_length_6374_cov_59_374822_g564_i0_p7_ORF_typecomplete_len104_score4_20DUF4946/PF16304_5/0_18_NODE_767_length_6374_cov_59_374822_g564_i019312242
MSSSCAGVLTKLSQNMDRNFQTAGFQKSCGKEREENRRPKKCTSTKNLPASHHVVLRRDGECHSPRLPSRTMNYPTGDLIQFGCSQRSQMWRLQLLSACPTVH